MSTLISKIYEYSTDILQNKLDTTSADEVKKRIVDSIFVAYGALNATPVKIARTALLPSNGKFNAHLYFSNRRAAVDTATFINGCMTRYLDYNDTYLSKEALHPSDNIPPILAYSEALDIDGTTTIKAIEVAYDLVCALADAVSIRNRGWDHVTYISISAAAGIASLLDLSVDKFTHVLNLAINNNISLRQTRAGELSMWKGCTAGNATRNSVFAALLGTHGLTGPAPIFEGEMGFFKQVSGKFDLVLANKLAKTMIKNHPVEYHAMSAVDAALELKNKITEKIQKIDVDTFSVAYNIIVKDPEKFMPKTKETADHSLPYIIAYTLLHGRPSINAYGKKYLYSKKLLALINKMQFHVMKQYDAMYPEYLPVKIKIMTEHNVFEKEVTVPKGHFKNPFTWNDLENKGTILMRSREKARTIVRAGQKFERIGAREFLEVLYNVHSS